MPALPCRRMFCLIALLVGAFFLGGCATPTAMTSIPRDQAAPRQRILAEAERLIGVRYVLGGESPNGVDCSGLVQYAYSRAGIRLPRTAAQQFRAGRLQTKVLPGDLLFFHGGNKGAVTHVGIYAGKGQMIHASSSTGAVIKTNLNQRYWKKHMVGGATFLGGGRYAPVVQWQVESGGFSG